MLRVKAQLRRAVGPARPIPRYKLNSLSRTGTRKVHAGMPASSAGWWTETPINSARSLPSWSTLPARIPWMRTRTTSRKGRSAGVSGVGGVSANARATPTRSSDRRSGALRRGGVGPAMGRGPVACRRSPGLESARLVYSSLYHLGCGRDWARQVGGTVPVCLRSEARRKRAPQ